MICDVFTKFSRFVTVLQFLTFADLSAVLSAGFNAVLSAALSAVLDAVLSTDLSAAFVPICDVDDVDSECGFEHRFDWTQSVV